MASHAPDFGRAAALPFSAVLGAIPSFPRPVIERLVARLIETLDEQDGDADQEDATDAEDEGLSIYARALAYSGPGCPVSDFREDDDPGGTEIDNGELDEAEFLQPVRQDNLPIIRRQRM